MRKTISLIHRYVGLTMTVFLVIVGLTGSVLAFQNELDRWLNPGLLVVEPRGQPTLDPFELQAAAEAADPRIQVDVVPLHLATGEAWSAGLSARVDPVTGRPFDLPFNQILFDPYTGQKTGERLLGEVTLRPQGLIAFLYRLHYSLALPEATGRLGSLILGIVALLWTVDCFVGVYLTLPARRRRGASAARHDAAKGWWPRWKPAWAVRWRGGTYKLNYDLHRAGGLWLWAMLFVLAWSSVAFNLNEVYSPVMKALFAMRAELPEGTKLDPPLAQPTLGWRDAHAAGRRWLAQFAAREGFVIELEEYLFLDREHGRYGMAARSQSDIGKFGSVVVTFDAQTGQLLDSQWGGGEKAGDTVTRWLVMLHMAAVGGLAMQVFVCLMGFVITTLAVTGVVVWVKKRKGEQATRTTRRAAASRRPAASGDQPTEAS